MGFKIMRLSLLLAIGLMMGGCNSSPKVYGEREVKILMQDAYSAGFVEGQSNTRKLREAIETGNWNGFDMLKGPNIYFNEFFTTRGTQGLMKDLREGKQ